MQKPLALPTLTAIAAVVICLMSPLVSHAQKKSGSGHSTANDTYIVIEVMVKSQNSDGKSELKKDFKAIASKNLRDEVKKAKDDYDETKKEWKDAVKSGSKDPMPRPFTPKKVPGSPIFDTQKGAQDYADTKKDEDAKKDDKGKNK